mmetsp:Transcript_1274/g.3037  ORF Transcript_1274/g.3037 Transcript_1274/m.3037 type:complete len:231 (-) Transcript_1274:331-1023(-)
MRWRIMRYSPWAKTYELFRSIAGKGCTLSAVTAVSSERIMMAVIMPVVVRPRPIWQFRTMCAPSGAFPTIFTKSSKSFSSGVCSSVTGSLKYSTSYPAARRLRYASRGVSTVASVTASFMGMTCIVSLSSCSRNSPLFAHASRSTSSFSLASISSTRCASMPVYTRLVKGLLIVRSTKGRELMNSTGSSRKLIHTTFAFPASVPRWSNTFWMPMRVGMATPCTVVPLALR